jgi:hypothetical protein
LLSDAVGAFLERVSERAFDQPLLSIIRAQGFESIHFTHGAREFGKDAVAQRDGEQWAWQSKAGNVGQPQWQEISGQLDELRLVNLGHGGFDGGLPRRAVLVITGRLVGNAPDLFRDYNDRARAKGEAVLELWDREALIGFLVDNPDAILRGSTDGQLYAALGSIESGNSTVESIEHFSRRWSTWEPERIAGLGVVEAATLCERLAANARLDLAAHLSLCLVRGVLAAGGEPEIGDEAARMFEVYAGQLLAEVEKDGLGDELATESGASAWVSYPVRCVRIAEIVGLLALRVRPDDSERADEIAGWLVQFLAAQPGAAHPISDSYAVSLIPATLAAVTLDPEAARDFLKSATIWLCDAYERDRLGLAGVEAAPAEEIERLLGGALEWVPYERRRESCIATVLLDLAAALACGDLYADIWNDIEAVGIFPRVLRLASGPDQFDRAGMENRLDPNVDFAESLEAPTPIAPHHEDPAGRDLCEAGRAWDLLAASSAIRDRHFYCALETFAKPAA